MLASGSPASGSGRFFRGLVCVLFRPRHRRFRLLFFTFLRLVSVSVVWRSRRLRFYFFSFAFCVGSYRGCGGSAPALFSFGFNVVSSFTRRFRVCHTSTALLNHLCFVVVRKSCKNANFGAIFLPRLRSEPRLLGGDSGRGGLPVGALVTIDLTVATDTPMRPPKKAGLTN